MSLPIKIKIPSGFLQEEIRDGYFVTEKSKKVWAVQLDLLNELTKVCKAHNITFQVSFGTLIGAVRHKGFIPWDDDFDVWMTRENIDKLIKLDSEFRHPYFLQTPINDRRYVTPLTRLRNSLTTSAIRGMDTIDYNNGIYIDIYAMDGVSTSRIKCAIQYILKRIVVKMWALRGPVPPACNSIKSVLERFLIRPISFVFTYEVWYKLYVKVLSMWTKGTDKLSHMVTCNIYGKHNWVLKKDMDETILLPFEWIKVPVPRNYDEILRRDYGDYMAFPPESERGQWHAGTLRIEPEVPYKEYLSRNNDAK